MTQATATSPQGAARTRTVLVERADGVVTVSLNRPQRRNAVNLPMVDELLEVLQGVAANQDDRVLVLTGRGDTFCSGADLADLPTDCRAVMRRIAELVLAVHRLPKPTVTSLNGTASGLGANLALAADAVVAAGSASLTQLFAHRAACTDGSGGWLLPRLVGARQAEELAFRADPITADQALKLGLYLKVVPDGDLLGATREYARKLAAAGPKALARTRGALRGSAGRMADAPVGMGGLRDAWRALTRPVGR